MREQTCKTCLHWSAPGTDDWIASDPCDGSATEVSVIMASPSMLPELMAEPSATGGNDA